MLTNKVQHKYRRMWDESVVGIKKYLVERTSNFKLYICLKCSGLIFI